MNQKRGNLLISAVIALAALAFFIWRGESSEQPSPSKAQAPLPDKGSFSKRPEPASTAGVGANSVKSASMDTTFSDAVSEANQNRKIPENLPEDLKRQLMAPSPQIPADIAAQMAAPPPPIPPEMQAQLAAPPPPLPPDLAAQLEGPPPELPEDMQRALETPPRIVTIDEVNDPNFVP